MGENSIKGKKLLILGGSPNEITLVERARELGVYVVVTDQYTDRKISPAKNYADEAWDISWSDIDALEKMCIKNHIDGVTAGYSEFRIENLILLCGKLGLPCYATLEQLEITRNKTKFKEMCRRNGIPVVKEYSSQEAVKSFPVIIKPVDRGGSMGISIAHNREELERAYAYAMECSVCKQVIIEDFIADAVKIDAYYIISDGEIVLLTTSDAVHAEKNNSERVVQSCWLFPSKKEKEYREKIDASVKKMIADLQIKNGYLFLSGFVNEENGFVFFETGFRLCGGHTYAFTPLKGLVNSQDIFIFHALTGNTKNVVLGTDLQPKLKTVILNFYSKSGIIKEIKGMNEIKNWDDCCFALQLAHIGEVCSETNAISTKIGMLSFTNASPDCLEKDVKNANRVFITKGENGEDLIYDRISPKLVKLWWER